MARVLDGCREPRCGFFFTQVAERLERAPVDVAGAVLANEPRVAWRDVSDVRREPVARIERVHPEHRPVADDLRHDRGRRDRGAPLVAVDDRDVRRRGRPEPEPVDETRLRGRRERMQRTSQPVQVRPVQPGAVDLSRRDDLHGNPGRARKHRPEQLLTVLRRDLLRIIQLRERPNAMVAQRVVVEKNAGNNERAGERAAACLVSPGDEASAEPSVELQQPLPRLRRQEPALLLRAQR